MSVFSFRCFTINPGKVNKISIFRSFLVRYGSTQKEEIRDIDEVTITVDNAMSEDQIEKICNKSCLNPGHRNLVNGRQPYKEPVQRFHHTVKYKRRMYGRYGESSHIYPGMAWPTKEDLEDIREYESLAYPLTIQEMQQKEIERLDLEQEDILKRQQKIDENMKKLNVWLKEVKEKASKKLHEAQEAKEKKEKLIEEVKKHFGYKIDPKDERFKEMLVKREKEEKKKIRDEKKKIRDEKLLNYLKTNQ